MRNLKLQMHISLDGYVTVEQGAVNFVWDEDVIKFCVGNLENVDTILLGQHTAQEFINFWDSVAANPEHPEFILGKRISGSDFFQYCYPASMEKYHHIKWRY